jgi:hypothetical protein
MATSLETDDDRFPYDPPKSAAEHIDDFYPRGVICSSVDKTTCVPVKDYSPKVKSDTVFTEEEELHRELRAAGEQIPSRYNLALKCGVESGLVVINIGNGRGDFVPNLKPGRYGVAHTSLGNLLCKTKHVITGAGNVNVIFGINADDWPDVVRSCVLVEPDMYGRGEISLLADDSYALIEPSIHPVTGRQYRFHTPFLHIPGAGGAFLDGVTSNAYVTVTYPLYKLGIMTLDRRQMSELLRAFNHDWINGPVFAGKNRIVRNNGVKKAHIGEHYDIASLIELGSMSYSVTEKNEDDKSAAAATGGA